MACPAIRGSHYWPNQPSSNQRTGRTTVSEDRSCDTGALIRYDSPLNSSIMSAQWRQVIGLSIWYRPIYELSWPWKWAGTLLRRCDFQFYVGKYIYFLLHLSISISLCLGELPRKLFNSVYPASVDFRHGYTTVWNQGVRMGRPLRLPPGPRRLRGEFV